jgi:predicted SnoaL-like aldol condensation-catalyzing enzyme
MSVTTERDELTKQHEDLIAEFRKAVFIDRNLAALDAYLAPNFVDHFASPKDPPGIAGVKQRLGQSMVGLRTTSVEIVLSVGNGDVLAQAILLHMEHIGALMGASPTHTELTIGGFDAFRVADGRITDHWGIYDVARIPDLLGLTSEEGDESPSWSALWPSDGAATAEAAAGEKD